MEPLVAIVGRPNVGKSTLFNRLLKKNKSLTLDLPGVTRDNVYGQVRERVGQYGLIDTGGLIVGGNKEFEQAISEQVQEAVAEADLVLLVVDGRQGLMPQDEEIANFLRQKQKKVLLVVNKVDGVEQEDLFKADFLSLGFSLVCASAAHGYNISTLREEILAQLTFAKTEAEPQKSSSSPLKLSLLGRPNVGKSSLTNLLFGKDKQIVSNVPGTTRDCVDLLVEKDGQEYLLIDTPGVRRKSHITSKLERFSVSRALTSSKRADLVLLMIDAAEGICHQDKKLISFLQKEHVPFLVLINKMDLVDKKDLKTFKSRVAYELRFCNYVPVLYISTKTGRGVEKILPWVEVLWAKAGVRIPTSALNKLLREVQVRYQPTAKKGRVKFYYVTQTNVHPPEFVFFVNDPKLIQANYKRFLENRIRELFDLDYVPIKIFFRTSGG